MKFLTKVFSLFVILAFFFSCSGKSTKGTKIRVSYWGDSKEIEIIDSIVKPWDEAHPEISVVLEHIPANQYVDKVLTMIAGGQAPDIIFCEVNNFVNFYVKDVFLPLDDFINSDTSFSIKDFYPEIVQRFTRDGKLYIIPRDIAPFACVFYNKDLFDLEGVPYPKDNWNTEDLIRIAKKLTKKDQKTGLISQYGFYGWAWWNWLYAFGGGYVDNFSNPTKIILDSKTSREGLKFYHDLMHVYEVSPRPGATDQSGADLFMTGRLAMYSSGIWESPMFRTITAFDWDVVMFPKGPTGKRGFGSGGSGYGISKTSKHPKEAWEVIKCLTDDAGQIKMAEAGLAQPAKISLARSEHFSGHPGKPLNKKMLDEAVRYICYDPFDPNWPEINRMAISPNLDLYFRDEKSLDETLQKIRDDMERLKLAIGK